MKTNRDKLVIQSVCGNIHHPTGGGYRVGFDGKGRIIPATGGITYNFKIGDSCMGIAGDHVEPCVSLQNPNAKENVALNTFACIGNIAKVTSGDAKGKTGIVTGTHGGIEHVFIHFEDDVVDMLNINDAMLIKSYGQGLELLDYPNAKVMNIDPSLFDKLDIEENNNQLSIGVTHIIPACLMGSGLGSATLMSGDYDIMTQDAEMNKKYNLDTLRFGDIVAIKDHNSINGPHFLQGSISIGVIVHSDSFTSGHGPGVAVFLTSSDDSVIAHINPDANLINYV